jgi:hypothetical protein
MSKVTKDEKYENMLRKIELNMDKKIPKSLLPDDDDDDFIQVKKHEPKTVSLSDLIGTLDNNPQAQNASLLKSQISELDRKTVKFL